MRPEDVLQRYGDALAQCGVRRLATPRHPASLASFYTEIPFRLPTLFEALCLSYWWNEATIGEVQLGENPASADLQSFAAAIRYDRHLWAHLLPHGYLIIGRMSGGRYDPCAFDMNRRKGHNAPLVRVDHEEILSHYRIGEPSLLADSFRAFLQQALGPQGGAA